jgi:hypothetical protein
MVPCGAELSKRVFTSGEETFTETQYINQLLTLVTLMSLLCYKNIWKQAYSVNATLNLQQNITKLYSCSFLYNVTQLKQIYSINISILLDSKGLW